MRADFFAILLRFAPVCFLGLLGSHALHLWQFGWVMILPPLFLYPMRPAALVDFGDQITKIYQSLHVHDFTREPCPGNFSPSWVVAEICLIYQRFSARMNHREVTRVPKHTLVRCLRMIPADWLI